MRTLTTHRCSKRHRSAVTFLRCRYPRIKVTGTGQLALFIRCDDQLQALLSRRLEQARILAAEYSVFGCCPACTRDHELAAVDIDADPELRAQTDDQHTPVECP